MPIINSVAESSSSEDENEDFPIGKIKQASDDSRHNRRKYEIIPDSSDTLIVENEPVERLEGVIKASDPSEWQKPIEVERGATKNLASMFQNIKQSDSGSKKPFKMDIEENAETIVVENEPVVLEGVVRSADKTEDVIGKRGRIKNLAGRFVNATKLSDDEEAQNAEKQTQKTIEIDTSKTRMIQEKWKQQNFNEPAADDNKPKEKVELVSAAEYGVYENEPAVRSDVVKGGVEQPDVIHVKHTRNLRKMWCQFEQQELAKERDSKNIESIVKAQKKTVQQEPEPQPQPPPVETPVEETKPAARKFGSKTVKKEADKTEPQQQQQNQQNQANNDAGYQKPTLRSVKRRF